MRRNLAETVKLLASLLHEKSVLENELATKHFKSCERVLAKMREGVLKDVALLQDSYRSQLQTLSQYESNEKSRHFDAIRQQY
jgi:hypothetical protein